MSNRRMNISHAQRLFRGPVNYPYSLNAWGNPGGSAAAPYGNQSGLPLDSLAKAGGFAPATLSANAIALSQTPGGAGNVTLNGAAVSGGVATIGTAGSLNTRLARCITITSAADISNRTFDITGTNCFGETRIFRMTGPNATTVTSIVALDTITQIAISGAAAGAITIGTADTFGLPFRVLTRNDLLVAWNGAFVTTGTFTAGVVTDPPIITTGDARGLYAVPDASNGTKVLTLYHFPDVYNSKTAFYGVDEFKG